jgi:hypothetical protein
MLTVYIDNCASIFPARWPDAIRGTAVAAGIDHNLTTHLHTERVVADVMLHTFIFWVTVSA